MEDFSTTSIAQTPDDEDDNPFGITDDISNENRKRKVVSKKKIDIPESKKSNKILKKNHKKDEDMKHNIYYNISDYEKYVLFCSTTIGGTMLKQALQIIAPLTPDAIIRFNQDGLSIFGMEQVFII